MMESWNTNKDALLNGLSLCSPLLLGPQKPAALTLVCPSVTVRGTLVEGHLLLGGKGLSQFHKTTIWTGKSTSHD